jgi:hypothetical protein
LDVELHDSEIEKSVNLYRTGILIKYLDPWQTGRLVELIVKLFVNFFRGGCR